jgi:hypothetical protein
MSQLAHAFSPFQPICTTQLANIFQPTNNELQKKQEREKKSIIKLLDISFMQRDPKNVGTLLKGYMKQRM